MKAKVKPFIECCKISIAGLLVLTCLSCKEEEQQPTAIQPVQIAQGNMYGGGSENIPKQDVVIATPAEWASLLEAMSSPYGVDFAEREVDFTKYAVIAVFEEVKGNGGWSIDITDVTEYADKITVTVRSLKTGDLTSVLTQPFHVVKIAASGKMIEFKHV
ncbi:MAG: protease complex subunit PrcB family protein [Prevotellaceae bacterium]|jgi:hypothetical protein|nr:protease complex subunit PrcB family protein [Prevotellaceae bacterium]